jgi:hypothetical protein
VQGFLMSRAVPAARFIELIRGTAPLPEPRDAARSVGG